LPLPRSLLGGFSARLASAAALCSFGGDDGSAGGAGPGMAAAGAGDCAGVDSAACGSAAGAAAFVAGVFTFVAFGLAAGAVRRPDSGASRATAGVAPES
jgi:hypothetical protein